MDYGDFAWLELITDDVDASIAFYRDVVGWSLTDVEMGSDNTYQMFSIGDHPIAGIVHEAPSEAVPNGWLGYLACRDLERTTKRAREFGAEVLGDIVEIETGGRFDIMRDPGGGIFACYEPETLDDIHENRGNAPGQIGWCELYSHDPDASMKLLTHVFGWDEGASMTMESGASYRMFNHGGADFGGLMEIPDMDDPPEPGWNFYFNVDDLDAAYEKASEYDTKILVGPMEVPGGSRVLVMRDPEGSIVSLTGE